MKEKGWVALHRKIQDHWLWRDKPFSKQAAWIDLLLLANHEDNKFLLGNELVEIECGSFITSELKLMQRWGWGKEKTRNFLKLLQSEGMIIKKSDRKQTTINIVNYKVFQGLQNKIRPQTDREQTTSRPRADHQPYTNNNDNNDNNDNKKEKIYKKESRHKYGIYQNVLLSDVELEKLKNEFSDWENRIERLSEYIASSGKSYKNHLATIRAWARKEKPQTESEPTRYGGTYL